MYTLNISISGDGITKLAAAFIFNFARDNMGPRVYFTDMFHIYYLYGTTAHARYERQIHAGNSLFVYMPALIGFSCFTTAQEYGMWRKQDASSIPFRNPVSVYQ
jgi:hypothetical protein